VKALYLWDAEYPWDIRVEKTCETLIDNDWEVHLVCRNRLRKPLEERYERIFIHRIPYLPHMLGKLNDIISFPLFFSPIWLKRMYQVAKKNHVDIIIARDLPMSLAAIMVGKIVKIPIILDMAECYPELIRLKWKFEPFKLQNIFIRNPLFVDVIERIVLRFIDHVFVMVEESKNRLIKMEFPEQKITIVSNTPILENFQKANISYPGSMKKHKEKTILLYVGLLNYSRGIDTVLESLSDYVKINNDIFFVIIGTGNAENYLRGMVEKLGLTKNVGFEGWINNKLIPEYIASADICLVPHHKCSHWDNTIPNKLFDYMAAAKSVLVSNVEPMKRIVQKTNSGMVYNDYDKESFINELIKLENKKTRDKLGENGLKAVQEHYNWKNDSKKMLDCIVELTRS